jgi:hypothetical protein
VRGKRVLVAVARHERDLGSIDATDADRSRRRAVGRRHRHLLHVVEEAVEAGAAEDADHGEPGVQIFERALARSSVSFT